MQRFARKQQHAAQVFGDSYAHYAEHLGNRPGMVNERFEKLTPDAADALAWAEREDCDASRLAKALDIVEGKV
jgi:hypothetical protein